MNRIKEHREAAGLSQVAVARVLGLPHPTVGRWESGKIDPPLSQAIRLALLLGVDLLAFVGWHAAMGTPS